MRTSQLRINQLSPEAYTWYLRYLESIDARDIQAYGPFLAENCVMRINNLPPVSGRLSILEGLTQYWQSFASVEHDLLNIYGTDSCFMLEALNHYVRRDGKPVTIYAVALTDRDRSGLVTSVRLYTDMSSLFSSGAGQPGENQIR
jgi:hypothetical protein